MSDLPRIEAREEWWARLMDDNTKVSASGRVTREAVEACFDYIARLEAESGESWAEMLLPVLTTGDVEDLLGEPDPLAALVDWLKQQSPDRPIETVDVKGEVL